MQLMSLHASSFVYMHFRLVYMQFIYPRAVSFISLSMVVLLFLCAYFWWTGIDKIKLWIIYFGFLFSRQLRGEKRENLARAMPITIPIKPPIRHYPEPNFLAKAPPPRTLAMDVSCMSEPHHLQTASYAQQADLESCPFFVVKLPFEVSKRHFSPLICLGVFDKQFEV